MIRLLMLDFDTRLVSAVTRTLQQQERRRSGRAERGARASARAASKISTWPCSTRI